MASPNIVSSSQSAPARLCPIYVLDIASLLSRDDVNQYQLVSGHIRQAIRQAGGRSVPRRLFTKLEIGSYKVERFPAPPPYYSHSIVSVG
jgi:hypothetical protein